MNKVRLVLMGVGLLCAIVVPRVIGYFAERNAAQVTQNAAIGAGPSDETENEKLGRKLGTYSQPCINTLTRQRRNSVDSYFRWARTEPLSEANTRPGTITRINTQYCDQAMRNAARLTPALPDVEIAGRNYLEAVKALDAVLGRAAEYYGEQNYKDDAFALGNTLHAEIKTAAEASERTEDVFRNALDGHSDRMTERRLRELASAPGRGLELRVTRVSHDALRLLRLVESSEIDETGKLVGMDVAAFQQQAAAFEASVDEALAYYQATPAERPTVENSNGYFHTVKGGLVAEVKLFARRLRDGGQFTEQELRSNPMGSGNVYGSPGRMLQYYNGSVDSYNRLRFMVLTTSDTN